MRMLPSAFAVLLTLAPALAQEKHTLRLKFVPGHVAHLLETQDMNFNVVMGEQKMTSTMNTATWSESKTTEVKDGVASIEHKETRLKARGEGRGMKLDYDSDVAGSNPGMIAAQAKKVGKTVSVRVDISNKVRDVVVPEDLDIDLERSGMDLKQALSQAFTTFPAEAIAIGESWTTTMEMPMQQMGTMKGTITNKLIDVKDNAVTIEQKIEMEMSGSKGQQGMKVTKAEGVSKIDLRTGLPIEATMDMEMKMGDMMTMSIRQLTKQIEAPAAKAPAATPADAPKAEPPKAEPPKTEPPKTEPPKTGGK